MWFQSHTLKKYGWLVRFNITFFKFIFIYTLSFLKTRTFCQGPLFLIFWQFQPQFVLNLFLFLGLKTKNFAPLTLQKLGDLVFHFPRLKITDRKKKKVIFKNMAKKAKKCYRVGNLTLKTQVRSLEPQILFCLT